MDDQTECAHIGVLNSEVVDFNALHGHDLREEVIDFLPEPGSERSSATFFENCNSQPENVALLHASDMERGDIDFQSSEHKSPITKDVASLLNLGTDTSNNADTSQSLNSEPEMSQGYDSDSSMSPSHDSGSVVSPSCDSERASSLSSNCRSSLSLSYDSESCVSPSHDSRSGVSQVFDSPESAVSLGYDCGLTLDAENVSERDAAWSSNMSPSIESRSTVSSSRDSERKNINSLRSSAAGTEDILSFLLQAEETQDRRYELTKTDRTTPTVRPFVSSSRRGSDDSGDGDTREMRKEIAELEEKWKKAMMNNAQLDNEKQTYRYQVDMLKDTLEEMEEQLIELQREHKDRCRELEAGKRNYKDLNLECTWLKEQLQLRDKLIEENGLVFVSDDTADEESKQKGETKKGGSEAALVTPDAANILALAEGSLDDRLKTFSSEKELLEEEVRKLKQQLEEERERGALAEKYASPKLSRGSNGPDMQLLEVQMLSAEGFSAVEAQRQLNDYKFKLKKCEQDITQLEGNVIRLESQVKRYKTAAENSEKLEEELKLEKRKLQRELRETQMTAEELQTSNHHLQKRLEKIKSTRNALKT